MQKLFLPMLFVIVFFTQAKAQQRLFDQPVILKSCSISIEANLFVATTIIEMEFYNARDQEVEARQNFQLNRGQVITDFQLELNGKYREGSIEERWKARQAYSSVVGKRIDPALLQMDWQDHYSLNIYPVAAKSSRKVKLTITQLMIAENAKLIYNLPLSFPGAVSNFKLDIKVNGVPSIPYVNKGLLENKLFDMGNNFASLSMYANDVELKAPVSFYINQFANQPQICISQQKGKSNFLMRVFPDVPVFYVAKPKMVCVYWDVSLSGTKRNLDNELDFLEKYISENQIDKTTITLFNQKLQGSIVYNRLIDNFKLIRNYLRTYQYTGATQLGSLNFNDAIADRILLFSDGVNSIGNDLPIPGAVQINWITSTYNYYYYYHDYYNYYYNNYYNNYEPLKKMIANTGGSIISLYNKEVKGAISRADTAENFLFRCNSNHIKVNEDFPIKLGKSILLSGTIDQSDSIELLYGNNAKIYKAEKYFFDAREHCDEETYKKVQMLKSYDSLMYGVDGNLRWQSMVIFGLNEKVVTPQTSFLVLERIEDYIKYKIAPPKELEEKCAEMNYVYKPAYKVNALKTFTEQEALESVVVDYNNRISRWSSSEPLIDLNRILPKTGDVDLAQNSKDEKTVASISGGNPGYAGNSLAGRSGLEEVVVTSAFQTKRLQRSVTSNVQVVTGEQVNTIRQTNINNALAGKVAGLQVRSQSVAALDGISSIRLGGESGFSSGSVLYVVDGTQIPNANDINPDDVADYTILQGPAATALYGPAGQNGVVVISLKKGKRFYYNYSYIWTEYKLSNAEDEDYVKAMKKAEDDDLNETFKYLEKENLMDVGFYFEMANFFFEKGKADKAQDLMYNAIELSQGKSEGLQLAAYMYEKWNWFDKAIAVYETILSKKPDNLMMKRNLALAYFQNKNFKASVKTYYEIITAGGDALNNNIKENALAEMNAVIAMHNGEFDISYINQNLVKFLPVDLRITVESNNNSARKVQFTEPGNAVCNSKNVNSTNGGHYYGNDYCIYNYNIAEYTIKNAPAGSYRMRVDADNLYSYPEKIPTFVRVITFKNFQQKNMEVEIKLFDLDNQYGRVELDPVKIVK